jgi:hypothetical protein
MMKNFKQVSLNSIKGIQKAVYRFSLSVGMLAVATAIIFWMIGNDGADDLLPQKLIFTCLVGAVLGMGIQFGIERFDGLKEKKVVLNGIAILAIAGYFCILLPVQEMSMQITIRTLVAVFALLCFVLFIPTYKCDVDFNLAMLIHFKSFFTSFLYGGVLSIGTSAILAAIHLLLFRVSGDTYSYIMSSIWVLFVPIYYLSLLPLFHSKEQEDLEKKEKISSYPKFLEILVSYIAIPLIGAYTIVLGIYSLKIIFTLTWPSGQVGPMVLSYSIIGIILFVLASSLKNEFAKVYQRIFPKALALLVIMQLVSVGIRLNAYGITESRYYVLLFGIFSLIAAILLSIYPVSKNGRIALLAAGFAVVSIIPPIDAFTLSRNSQIKRLEKVLIQEDMLSAGVLTAKKEASQSTKIEVTNILHYLRRSGHLYKLSWLPENFNVYSELEEYFGFEATYPSYGESIYKYVFLNEQAPVIVSGYDIMLSAYGGASMKQKETGVAMGDKEVEEYIFEIEKEEYVLVLEQEKQIGNSVRILQNGEELISAQLDEFAKDLLEQKGESRSSSLSPEEMSFEVENNAYRLRVMFRHISYARPDEEEKLDYMLSIFFGK